MNKLNNIIILSATLISLSWTQSIGMLARSGENLLGFEFSHDKEDVDGGEVTANALLIEYILNGNIELGLQYSMATATNDNDSSLDFDVTEIIFGGYYHLNENLDIYLGNILSQKWNK